MNEGYASMLPPPSGKPKIARVILETMATFGMSIEKVKWKGKTDFLKIEGEKDKF